MQAASLDLCRTLFELSGWDDCGYFGFNHNTQEYELGWQPSADHKPFIPAYDLSYLLRKLPPEIEWDGYDTRLTLVADHKNWHIGYQNRHRHWMVDKRADTPENACAQLCIKLFKRGILTREDKG